MKGMKALTMIAVTGLAGGAWIPPAVAGDAPARQQVEHRTIILAEQEQAAEEREQAEQERTRAMEEKLKAAEERLEAAAREIAEITSTMVPGALEYARSVVTSKRRPLLGVSIGSREPDAGGEVEGVEILGVSPGSPAEEAGVRAGDLITAVDGDSLAAASAAGANRQLLEALAQREPGDTVELQLSRDGETLAVAVATREEDAPVYAVLPDHDFEFDFTDSPPMVWFGSVGPWGDMELVELSPQLGRYFGADSGLLVVRAPTDPALQLQDGDVIRSIGGREPTSVSHAMRILRSYAAGEELELDILRDKRRRELTVEIPTKQGRLRHFPAPPPSPARAPSPAPGPAAVGLPEV